MRFRIVTESATAGGEVGFFVGRVRVVWRGLLAEFGYIYLRTHAFIDTTGSWDLLLGEGQGFWGPWER